MPHISTSFKFKSYTKKGSQQEGPMDMEIDSSATPY